MSALLKTCAVVVAMGVLAGSAFYAFGIEPSFPSLMAGGVLGIMTEDIRRYFQARP